MQGNRFLPIRNSISRAFRATLALPLLLGLGLQGAPGPACGSREALDWGYWGPGAPNNWGSLSPEFDLCATGASQSPIDLNNLTVDSSAPELVFDYAGNAAEINHNGKVAR